MRSSLKFTVYIGDSELRFVVIFCVFIRSELNSIEDDIKEATIELPKMVNAEINENITATKKCPFCGAENEYSSKSCVTCGNSLN